MLTLADINALPNNPNEDHLRALGLLPQPAAPVPIIPPTSGKIPTPSPITPAPAMDNSWKAKLMGTTPHATAPLAPLPPVPDMGGPIAPTATPETPFGANFPKLAPLNFKERQALPTTSEGAAPGSSAESLAQLERLQDQKANPWGSPENHPGIGGKIAHVAAKIGNIAGDILAPATMANIPGTDLNKQIQERRLEGEIAGREGRELAAKKEETSEELEATREKHEENLEDTNQQKLDQAEKKIEEQEKKHLSDREIALRKEGLKPNPADPQGTPIPLAPEDMSQLELDAHAVRAGRADAELAKAALDKIKADPNSPQSQASLARVRIMAQNAATAAGRLGLDKKKYLADYFGMDENLDPLPGAQTTPEGKPIGPKVARTTNKELDQFNTHYEKPANDTERAYQLYQEALKAYNSGDTKTGASTMLALSQHIGTTFGQIKGSRMNKDLINEHKDAIGIEDKLERFAASLERGDQLSANQMKEFGDQIHAFRNLSWQTAVKEAKRANLPVNFLPEDLNRQMGGGGGGHPTEPPGPPAAGMKWQQNKRTGEFRQVPIPK